MRVVCISDTHGHHDFEVPHGDLLIHAGDCSRRGRPREILAFNHWLGTLPHPHKVVIAGNHDFAFEQNPTAREWITHATYLQDELFEVDGLRIWGSPWQPRFFDWAFNLDRGAPLAEKWAQIPAEVDILVTHGPPHGILDRVHRGENVGCRALLDAVLGRKPTLHVFGHIHEAYGVLEDHGVCFANASTCTVDHRPVNPPLVFEV